MPVVIETENEPANTVEKDAGKRLGAIAKATGDRIKTVIAVRLKGALATINQYELAQALRKTR